MQTRWLMLTAGMLVGCQTTSAPIVTTPTLNIRTAPELASTPAVHTSRYVTERAAGAEMVDILGIPLEARLPVVGQMTVEEGMAFLLNGSGVSLRPPSTYAQTQLYAQPLPMSHSDLGKLPLRSALQIMAGQAFMLEEDVVRREVGFRLKPGYVPPKPRLHDNEPRVKGWSESAHLSDIAMTPALTQSLKANKASLTDNDALFVGESTSRSTPAKQKMSTYRVKKGETYRKALTRWAHKEGNRHLAFAQDATFLKALESISTTGFEKTGTLSMAVAALTASVPRLSSMRLHPNPRLDLVAFHPWAGDSVTTIMIQGNTLKQAVKDTVKHYDWHWDEAASWPVNDYSFSAFPLVTRQGDISSAMATILGPYPLKAQRLDATKTIYVQESNPL